MILTDNQKIGNFIRNNPNLFAYLKAGDLVEGKVLEKSPRAMMVDLGKFGTGIVYRGELMNAKGMVRDLEEGDKMQAKVVEVDNDEGLIELSLSEAQREKSWSSLNELYEKEEVFEAKIIGSNKGGLLSDVHEVKAFLPASQLSKEHYPNVPGNDPKKIEEELNELVGKKLEVKIITADPGNNKLIISEKAAREVSAKELAKEYEVGQVVEGMVSGVADFGAFVQFTENPEVEGLIHISELAHRVVDNPKEILGVDDVVDAKIIDIKNGKISLSIKALAESPWEQAQELFEEGQEIEGEIYTLNPFGATVALSEGIQGQVHVTEFGGEEEMKKQIKPGETHKFKIKEVKKEDQRINLEFLE